MSLLTVSHPAPLTSLHGNKPIAYDVHYLPDMSPKPVIVFVHGFKGFKDWGYFNLLADTFARAGFVFVKINLSHNGTSPAHPTDFVDLEAFGHNNFSIELDDLGVLIDHLSYPEFGIPAQEMDLTRLSLMGHSRGGSLVLLKAHEDTRVKQVITMAAVSDLEDRWPQSLLDEWKKAGVYHIQNSRTKQNMPLYYQIVKDYYAHKERFQVPEAIRNLTAPILAFHGTNDETVPVSMAEDIRQWNTAANVQIIEGANHTFGGKHPYEEDALPEAVQQIIDESVRFLKGPTSG
uniref:Alpha/beta fold hydrolase n=1 Tax=Roseihalotalea indica TaxID=2867963 RepID=A0AA49GS57_9BACT|nr:alpha/beta fold hydrolase [Tunicatimonas sp. TK19036]